MDHRGGGRAGVAETSHEFGQGRTGFNGEDLGDMAQVVEPHRPHTRSLDRTLERVLRFDRAGRSPTLW